MEHMLEEHVDETPEHALVGEQRGGGTGTLRGIRNASLTASMVSSRFQSEAGVRHTLAVTAPRAVAALTPRATRMRKDATKSKPCRFRSALATPTFAKDFRSLALLRILRDAPFPGDRTVGIHCLCLNRCTSQIRATRYRQSAAHTEVCAVPNHRSDTLRAMIPYAEQPSRQRYARLRSQRRRTAFDPLSPPTAHKPVLRVGKVVYGSKTHESAPHPRPLGTGRSRRSSQLRAAASTVGIPRCRLEACPAQSPHVQVTYVVITRRREFRDSSLMRTPAPSRAEHESPRARVPYIAGCESPPGTRLRTGAHVKYWNRSPSAYGHRRSSAGTPRTYVGDQVRGTMHPRTSLPWIPPRGGQRMPAE